MTWTRERPAVDGFYWHRQHRRVTVAEVCVHGDHALGVVYYMGTDCFDGFSELKGDVEWCGPIEPPL